MRRILFLEAIIYGCESCRWEEIGIGEVGVESQVPQVREQEIAQLILTFSPTVSRQTHGQSEHTVPLTGVAGWGGKGTAGVCSVQDVEEVYQNKILLRAIPRRHFPMLLLLQADGRPWYLGGTRSGNGLSAVLDSDRVLLHCGSHFLLTCLSYT